MRGDPDTGTRQNLNLLLGVVGGKVNIGRGVLVNAGVLFPLEQQRVAAKRHAVFQFRLRLLDTESGGRPVLAGSRSTIRRGSRRRLFVGPAT